VILEYDDRRAIWLANGSPWNGGLPCNHYKIIRGPKFAIVNLLHRGNTNEGDVVSVRDNYSASDRELNILLSTAINTILREMSP
jgi:hypothetical protein